MGAELDQFLGPVTEARFLEVFSRGALATRADTAGLLSLDVKTLDALTDAQVIRAVTKGAHRAWTERALRQYLIEGPDRPCAPKDQPDNPPKPKAQTPPRRGGKVVNFSELRRTR